MKKKGVGYVASALICGVMLCACNGTLSEDKALTVAQKIVDKRKASSFAYPETKFTYTLSESINKITLSSEYRSQKGVYYYAATTTNAFSSTASESVTVSEYVYTKDGVYYDAMATGSYKTYSKLTQSAYAARLTLLEKSASTELEKQADDQYSSLEDIIKERSSKTSSATTSSATSQTFTYASKGEGDLTVKAHVVNNDSSNKGDMTISLAFHDSLPVSENLTGNVQEMSSGVSETLDEKIEVGLDWSHCEAIYPAISEYSLTTL